MLDLIKWQLGIKKPSFLLCFTELDWQDIHRTLRQHSAGGRESGGYLLGTIKEMGRGRTQILVSAFLPYRALGATSSAQWLQIPNTKKRRVYRHCRELECSIIGDIHTHPNGVEQSEIDKQNPMNPDPSRRHVALILPKFATPQPATRLTGIYRHVGRKNRVSTWQTIPRHLRRYHINTRSTHHSHGIIT